MTQTDGEHLRRLITERVSGWSGVPAANIPGDRPLVDFGMSSRAAVALAGELAGATGRALPATLLWETPTVDGLVGRLTGQTAPQVMCVPRTTAASVVDEPIAVVGVGCRLPGAVGGPDDYWRLLIDGSDAIRRVPGSRWRDFTASPPEEANPWGGYLDDDTVSGFDAEFFHVSPREAAAMDPQQRMLLEVAHEALDHAAIPAASLAGTATGVFVGVSAHDYGQLTAGDPADVDPWAATGSASGVAAGRIAYVLDLRGPSVAVDTACSSSLVAVHQACAALRLGECDTALSAGANILLSPAVTVAFGRAGALAPDGRCKPFSAAADGIGRAEGCAAVVLKRLPDALRDGDRVLALVRSTAVNSDGRSNGIMAPSPDAQRALLKTAYARAGIDPIIVDYVEAHGTGTPLGDPIEAGALADVLGRDRDPDQPLLLGSVKGNLGHLEAAAGIAGLVKTVLALHHDTLPGTLHCDRSALGDERLRVVTEPEPWPRYGGTALAGVSAFGFGGTNAHVVLEEWPAVSFSPHQTGTMGIEGTRGTQPAVREAAPVAFALSDASQDRVRDTAVRLADWLGTPEGRAAPLQDIARTLAGRVGRGPARAAVVARDRDGLSAALGALAAGRPDPGVTTGDLDLIGPGPVWVFSGHGTGWAGMGRQLLAEEPAFAEAVQKLEPVLAAECGISLSGLLDSGTEPCGPDSLRTAQPLLFGMQLALAGLWRSYGVEPAAVIGHSMGEVAAAVVAGALDPADGARVMAVRSRLLATLRGGAMAVADLDDDEAASLERDFPDVHIAVHSSPRQKVIAGEVGAVGRLADQFTADGRMVRVMQVDGAGHSPQTDPLLPDLTAALVDVRGRDESDEGRVRVYSTVHDDPRAVSRFDAGHWAANLRRPVRFAQAVSAARADGHTAFVEISPHPALLHPVIETVPDAFVLPTLRRDTDTALTFRQNLAALYTAGHPLPRPDGQVTDVPLPRWRHHHHWWTGTRRPSPPPPARSAGAAAQSLGGDAAVRPGDATAVPPPGPGGTTATERLIHHVAAISGHRPQQINRDTRLADLGLDSLMATRIRGAVEREFGVAPPLGELLQAGTIGVVADRLTAGSSTAPHTAPVRVVGAPHGTGTRPPLFLAHAAGGACDVYGRLSELLGPGQPVHGLERIEEADSVTAKAELYAAAIRAVRPDGPYRLGGWSFGGFVAQETARLLVADGATVDAVVLIDSVRPLPRPAGRTAWDVTREHYEGFADHVLRTYDVRLDLPYEELAALDDRARIDLVLKTLSAAADIPPAALEHQRASYLDMRIGEAHTPGRYDGRVILYRATEAAPHTVHDAAYERDDAAAGWDGVCPRLEVVRVPGHHLSLLDPPSVQVIADHLSSALA